MTRLHRGDHSVRDWLPRNEVGTLLRALDEKPRNWEDTAFYSHIAARIRALARRHDLLLRVVDRALWTWAAKAE